MKVASLRTFNCNSRSLRSGDTTNEQDCLCTDDILAGSIASQAPRGEHASGINTTVKSSMKHTVDASPCLFGAEVLHLILRLSRFALGLRGVKRADLQRHVAGKLVAGTSWSHLDINGRRVSICLILHQASIACHR